MITASVLIDLRDVKPDAARHRVGALALVPDGARLVLVVGSLAVNPSVVWLLAEHVHRLHIDVWGEPWNMPRWLNAVRTGEVLGVSP